MRYLLDTHVLLWFATGDRRLRKSARELIEANPAACFVSAASLWEMVLKHEKGRLFLAGPFKRIVPEVLRANRFRTLAVKESHVFRLLELPHPREHKDPFDRLLVAQSLCEGMPLMSSDDALDAYGVERVW